MAPLRTSAVFPALESDSALLYKYTELRYAGSSSVAFSYNGMWLGPIRTIIWVDLEAAHNGKSKSPDIREGFATQSKLWLQMEPVSDGTKG